VTTTVTTAMTSRPGTGAGAVARTGPLPRCPRCAAALDGGPVAYRCGCGVMAADIDTEYHHPPAQSRVATTTGGGSP
jgi:hypothetical protein